jgi:secondary thiamine-phosphate synthase enzyme
VSELKVETQRRTQLLEVTERIAALVEGVEGSIVLQAAGEGATAVAGDVEAAFDRIVDESWAWEHVHEGDANPWSHVRTALTASSVSIPLEGGRLGLGAHQAVFLAEFDGPRARTIRVIVSR